MIFNPLRPTIQWFAQRMEQTLLKHDLIKGVEGWQQHSLNLLKRKLHSEVAELSSEFIKKKKDYKRIVEECIDIANIAMMVADKAQTMIDEAEEEDC